jgi:hypothetical protein
MSQEIYHLRVIFLIIGIVCSVRSNLFSSFAWQAQANMH